MKIAILTLPLHANSGGNLQCYALQNILKAMGHEVTNINIQVPDEKMPRRELKTYWKRIKQKISGKKDIIIFFEKKINNDRHISHQHAIRFINKYISSTPRFTSEEELAKLPINDFDAFILGSDQVWRIPYAYPSVETYFFNFLKDSSIKRIAYGASFGTDEKEFSDKQAKTCGKLLQDFCAISVREDTAINLIENIYQWKCPNVVQVLDPTLLLHKEDYLKLISNQGRSTHKGSLFYYILDMTSDKQQFINQVATYKNLLPFTVYPKSVRFEDKAKDKIFPPTEEWIQAFDNAEYVITDSFHGCVFSIIFNKPFIAYGNEERGMARFTSLLKLFNLENRLIISSSTFPQDILEIPINWKEITAKLKELQNTSISFLQDALKM